MNKFGNWLFNFMQGRYGFDQFGRALSIGVVVFWIIAIIIGVFSNLFGFVAAVISSIFNWIGLALMVFMLFRIFSKNHEKRRAENEWYLNKTSKSSRAQNDISFRQNAQGGGDESAYKYLSCQFCGKQMRVPAGKGKIAVKCPSCGEKTIIVS